MGKLVTSKQFKSIQTSHIGTNKETQAQFNAGTLKIEFNPQGTLAERIRAGGAGLGGFLTPTGVGTILEKEKQKITVDGKEFFLERPIRGDYSLIRAKKADKMGNLIYDKTGRNSNPVVAMASEITIVEVDELVEIGELRSEEIVTPGMFIDYIVIHKD
jgi:3-oxoacid CoA-transferase A subunit